MADDEADQQEENAPPEEDEAPEESAPPEEETLPPPPGDDDTFEPGAESSRIEPSALLPQSQYSELVSSYRKITKVQIDPGATIEDEGDDTHYMTSLPVMPEEPTPYIPMLYAFRLKSKSNPNFTLGKFSTKIPPFYLQFDHCIAVIWSLFNESASKEKLGIVQLNWALYFLESIRNREGNHPRDVQLCIEAIQDYLIEQYAELSEEDGVYNQSHLSDFTSAAENPNFSVNYTQIEQRFPKGGGKSQERLFYEGLENVKKIVGVDDIDVSNSVSREKAINVLSDWKKEQIDRILEELKMLHTVEDMMKNVDEENFEGYTDEKEFLTIFNSASKNESSN